jgi:excisionase family DNA binding protein
VSDDEREEARAPAEWLTLGQACRQLGVSEPTLRKWTDEGRVDVFVTPGGHRRYRQSTITDLAADIRRRRALGVDLEAEYRREVDDRHNALAGLPWYRRLNEGDKVRLRVRGMAVITALEEHIEGRTTEHEALASLAELGRAYGMDLARIGLSPRETMEAFAIFRGSVMDSIRRVAERPGRGRGLSGLDAMQRSSSLLDQMAVAIIGAAAS